MSATMKPERTYTPEVVEPPLSPAQRLAQAAQLRPFKTKDVDFGAPLGRFRFRELKQREIEEVTEPLVKRTFDAKGNVSATTDSRGHHARAIAFAMVNDDGSNVFANPLAEGVAVINELPKDVAEKMWEVVDELNLLSQAAKDKLGKESGTPKTDGGLA